MAVDSWYGPTVLVLSLLQLALVDVGVYGAGFVGGWDSASHPGCAASELVVGCEDGPVECVLERDRAVDCADHCLLEEVVAERARGCGIAVHHLVLVAIGLAIGGAVGCIRFLRPRCWESGVVGALEISGVLLVGDRSSLRRERLDLDLSAWLLIVPTKVVIRARVVLWVFESNSDRLLWDLEPLVLNHVSRGLGCVSCELRLYGARWIHPVVRLQEHVEKSLEVHDLMLQAYPEGATNPARLRWTA